MASVKVKFRASTVVGKKGGLYYQVIKNRVVRQLNTDYKIFADEWNAETETVIVKDERPHILASINERIQWDLARFAKIINKYERERTRYTAADVIDAFQKMTYESSFFSFMHQSIVQLRQLGRVRTSETYTAALRSFMLFRENQDIPLDGISSDIMLQYEAWLKNREIRMNTISFYMRILRAVYNRAVDKDLTPQRHPFRHVYTGIDKTVKRAIPIKVIKTLKNLDLSLKPSLDFARDMFLFSFYTRGMSFVDMAYLKKKNLQNGFLTYSRRKTGQQLTVKWEKCMDEIVKKYTAEEQTYLLPIITQESDERRQYINAMHLVNKRLKELSEILNLPRPLTMYVARHSWASAAKAKNVPLSVISEGMGHDSETTTQIYLASLDTAVVDKANKMILSLLC